MESLTLTRPDDWHLHLRDGEVLGDVVPYSAGVFRRAIIMPNLRPPVTEVAAAISYRRRILAATPGDSGFEPLMTLYLTDNTSAAEIERAAASGVVHAIKLYPAGATTNADSGVTDLTRCNRPLAAMAECGLPLLLHGETADPSLDIFEREEAFLQRTLPWLLEHYPQLRIVLEHITSAAAAAFVHAGPERLAATITAHHLLYQRNDMLAGGIRPHLYCLPILKREADRAALIEAATSGNPRFFLGTDSAPHGISGKETACGCAGVFSAPIALGAYAEAFAAAGRLDRLEAFAAHHGADFYGLPRNPDNILLRREPTDVPKALAFGSERIVPLRAGGQVDWQCQPC